MAEEIVDADILATAVGVNALPRIVKPLAEGLKKRWNENNRTPLNIIICENLLDADHCLSELIMKELNTEQKQYFKKLVGMVEASIGRMVPLMTPEIQKDNMARICVEEYSELPVDKDGFKGEIPYIKNMLPVSPFAFYIQRKLFIHNMGHAMTAYLGSLKGYQYIWEAIEDPVIKYAVIKAMQDSAMALSRKHGIGLEVIYDYIDDLICRFGNKQLGDTICRVGNDTRRKLSPNDRLVGAANLCSQYGIMPVYICIGIAAALKFDSTESSGTNEVKCILEAEGPEMVLKKICGLCEADSIWDIVLEIFRLTNNSIPINKILKMAGERK